MGRRQETNPFYLSPAWRRLRRRVLAADKYECQDCKARGRYTRANTVHHVMHLDEHPELALSETYQDETGAEHRQLVSLCHDCHEQQHEYRAEPKPPPLTPERW